MKRIILALIAVSSLILTGCTYNKEVCTHVNYDCKVIAVENIYSQISRLEDEMTMGMQARGKTTREVILDCGDLGRVRKESDTLIVGDQYTKTEERECKMIPRDSETDQPLQ